MKGTRPLDNFEIRSVSTCFTGTFQVYNRGPFMLGVSTGGRISELLRLMNGDVLFSCVDPALLLTYQLSGRKKFLS